MGKAEGEAELTFGCGSSESEEPQRQPRRDVRVATGYYSLEFGAEVQAESKKQFLKGKIRQGIGEND